MHMVLTIVIKFLNDVDVVQFLSGVNGDLVSRVFFMSENLDHMQVLVRTRPVGNAEASAQGFTRCIRQDGPHTITWLGQPETRFTFDHVAGESITQVHN